MISATFVGNDAILTDSLGKNKGLLQALHNFRFD